MVSVKDAITDPCARRRDCLSPGGPRCSCRVTVFYCSRSYQQSDYKPLLNVSLPDRGYQLLRRGAEHAKPPPCPPHSYRARIHRSASHTTFHFHKTLKCLTTERVNAEQVRSVYIRLFRRRRKVRNPRRGCLRRLPCRSALRLALESPFSSFVL